MIKEKLTCEYIVYNKKLEKQLEGKPTEPGKNLKELPFVFPLWEYQMRVEEIYISSL